MPISDKLNWLHGTDAMTTGVDIGHSGSEYTADEIDTEITSPGYGKAGAELGLHVLVNEVFNTLTSADISIVHGAATSPTTVVATRNVVLASLVAGAHIYVPWPKGMDMLRYLRGYFAVNGSNPTTGQVCVWFGPPDGSENT